MSIGSSQEVQYRHSDGDAVCDLLKDDRVLAIGQICRELYVAIDWSGMHDRDRFCGFVDFLFRHAKEPVIFA